MPRRDHVARRSPSRRWSRRIVGILATAAMFAVVAIAASLIFSPPDDEVAANSAPAKSGGGKQERTAKPDVAREDTRAEA